MMWLLKVLGIIHWDISDITGKFDKLQTDLENHTVNMKTKADKASAKAAIAQAKADDALKQGARAKTIASNLGKILGN